MNNSKILTPHEAKQKAMKPWLDDIEKIKQECMLAIDNAINYCISKDNLGLSLFKSDIFIMFGEFDNSFVYSVKALSTTVTMSDGEKEQKSVVSDISIVKTVVDMWYRIKDELSNNFVDNNPDVCKVAIALLESVKTNNIFNKKQCNEIINRLYQKGVSNETVNEVEQKEETQT